MQKKIIKDRAKDCIGQKIEVGSTVLIKDKGSACTTETWNENMEEVRHEIPGFMAGTVCEISYIPCEGYSEEDCTHVIAGFSTDHIIKNMALQAKRVLVIPNAKLL